MLRVSSHGPLFNVNSWTERRSNRVYILLGMTVTVIVENYFMTFIASLDVASGSPSINSEATVGDLQIHRPNRCVANNSYYNISF